jgi:hypothetical protein
MKFTSGRRYFCTRYSKADWSPAFTRSITSASVEDSLPVTAAGKLAAACGPIAAIRIPRSMAAVLTLISTPPGLESCTFSSLDELREVSANEEVRGDRESLESPGMQKRSQQAEKRGSEPRFVLLW